LKPGRSPRPAILLKQLTRPTVPNHQHQDRSCGELAICMDESPQQKIDGHSSYGGSIKTNENNYTIDQTRLQVLNCRFTGN
jgi:hypothetical protein